MSTETKKPTKLGEAKRQTNPVLIEFLTEVLEHAKAGRITAMAATGRIDGFEHLSFCHGMETTDELLEFIGLTEALKARLALMFLNQAGAT